MLEQHFLDAFETFFTPAPAAKLVAARVNQCLREARLNNNEQADFKAWMERTHGVKHSRTKTERLYNGIRLNGVVEGGTAN